MRFIQVGILLLLYITFAATHIVHLPNGKLQGVILETYYSFTNIRYAEPVERFETSVPYERRWNEIAKATEDPVTCVPFGKRTNSSDGQEDCLVVNVFTPKTATTENPLPVLIHIHGGAFMFGSSGLYSPETIMAQGRMVVASFNYRLGPLGFLSTGDNAIPGNLGLKDQLLALRWIKKNIQFFGGDPNRILLTGQSAGGASVHLHILRKETESLASAAASFSGTSLNPWVIQQNFEQKSNILGSILGCPLNGEELKACLRYRSLEDIHAAVLRMQTFLDNPFNVFGPIIEPEGILNAFLTDDPRSLIQKGYIANIPWMATFTTEDGSYNCGSLLEKNDGGVEQIEELNQRWYELAPTLLFYYDEPADEVKRTISESLRLKYMGSLPFSRDTYPLMQKMCSDVLFIDGIRETIELHRAYGISPVSGYVYGNPHNYGVGNFLAMDLEYQFGAAHGDDEELLLPLTISTNYTSGINDKEISMLMIDMLESFVLNGVARFGCVDVPQNGNNNQPMQYLQILQQGYCVGPWENYAYSSRQCNACACYNYSRRRINNNRCL